MKTTLDSLTRERIRCKLLFLAIALGNLHIGTILTEDECSGIEYLLDEIANEICPEAMQGTRDNAA